jgi:ATP/maltotriose-dependent transcriptional regulator MalT
MSADVALSEIQDQFVHMLPEIQSRAGATFRHLDPEAREEAVAETLALSWKNHLHCASSGKAVGASSLAHYAVLGVKSGRSLCGQSATDVQALRTQLLRRATVESFDALPLRQAESGWWERSEALEDKRLCCRPFHRVRIRHDYGAFLALPGVSDQERRVFQLLADGNRTSEIARQLRVSAPRVCQVKSALGRKLRGFFGPDVDPNPHWPATTRP